MFKLKGGGKSSFLYSGCGQPFVQVIKELTLGDMRTSHSCRMVEKVPERDEKKLAEV